MTRGRRYWTLGRVIGLVFVAAVLSWTLWIYYQDVRMAFG